MAIKTNHSENLAVRGIPNDSFLPLDRNIAIDLELFLYGNAAGTQREVKINATASVHTRSLNYDGRICCSGHSFALIGYIQVDQFISLTHV